MPKDVAPATRRRWLEGAPVTDRRRTLAGVSTAVIEGGDGAPLVLLHGQGGFGGMFLPILGDLVDGNRVVVPDLPGLGASRVPDGQVDRSLVMRWLDALVEETCDTPPTLLGHSLGGSIAARYASALPRRIRRLVLVDAGGLTGRVRPPLGVLLLLVRMSLRPSRPAAGRFMRRIMHDPDRTWAKAGPQRRERFIDYQLELAGTPSVRRANQALLKELGLPAIPPEELDRIDVPTDLVWGRHDPIMPLDGAREAGQRHGWPLQIVEEAGHVPFLEQPAAFLDALRQAGAA